MGSVVGSWESSWDLLELYQEKEIENYYSIMGIIEQKVSFNIKGILFAQRS